MNNIIIKSNNLSKSYDDGHAVINVLTGISLDIYQGDSIAIVGPSGSGKSTLLHLLGGLDNPTSGEVFIKGNNWQSLQEKKRCMLRNTELGFVYQFHHLLPEFSALENVAMPLLMRNIKINDVKNRAYEILCSVGLENRVNHKPKELSGGERARVAIARALIHKPSCILADEPTGNLDQHTASQVFNLMLEINQDIKTALVIVTHDKNIAYKMQRILTLEIGQLVERA